MLQGTQRDTKSKETNLFFIGPWFFFPFTVQGTIKDLVIINQKRCNYASEYNYKNTTTIAVNSTMKFQQTIPIVSRINQNLTYSVIWCRKMCPFCSEKRQLQRKGFLNPFIKDYAPVSPDTAYQGPYLDLGGSKFPQLYSRSLRMGEECKDPLEILSTNNVLH